MLLREMASSAFGRTFKRFAWCAVAGLALAGLAACGGGGSSTPAETAPTTPTPDPAPTTPTPDPTTPTPDPDPTPPQMNIEPANKYLSLATGSALRSTIGIDRDKLAWAFGVGATASAAEEEAKTQCDRLLGSSCNDAVSAVTDACSAFAMSECDDNCLNHPEVRVGGRYIRAFPHSGYASGALTKEGAETVAIGSCRENDLGTSPSSGSTCQIATSDTGQRAVACVGIAGTTTSPPPRGVWLGEASVLVVPPPLEEPPPRVPPPSSLVDPPSQGQGAQTQITGENGITFTMTDGCNDGRDVEFRIFQVVGGSVTGRYPGSRVLITRGFEMPGTTSVACQAGSYLCIGGRKRGVSSSSYGLGVDGSSGCTDCCYACPTGTGSASRGFAC